MAEQGLVVSHCIAQPLCTPSRVKLMTGLSNAKNYTHFGRLDTSWMNMGTLMKEAGYRTCITGKWQLNGLAYKDQFADWNDPTRPHQMGFDEYCLWQLTHGRSEGERFSNPLIEQNGEVLQTGPDDYGPDLFCDYALDFIEKSGKDPFFLYYPMVLVHEPFVPTPDSESWSQTHRRYEKDTAYFAHMMTYTDKILGKIWDKLKEQGIEDQTILIFTADNGTHPSIYSRTRERMVRGAKGNTISDGVRVPLLIHWPEKIKGSRRYEGLIEFSDFFATLCDLTGTEMDSDGQSFLPLLTGRTYQARESVNVHYDPRWGANVNRYRNSFVQTMDHKLYQDGSFYRLKEDILEEKALDPTELDPEELGVYQKLKDELRPRPVSQPAADYDR
jgi:arylsulfatase A